MRRPATAAPAGFLAAVERRADRTAAPPPGAFADREGRWVAGNILLTDTTALSASRESDGDRTDAALVLAAIARHGAEAVSRLRGEFAFVAWDAPRRTLLAARDGLGLQLLFFAVTRDVIACADDPARLAALDGVDASLDLGALAAFLADGMDADLTRTVYRGVRSLPAAHVISWSLPDGDAECRRHWQFPLPAVLGRRAARELPAMFTAALDASVRDRLRGPTASILLSGGIDSASIAASALRVRPEIALRAFTSTYEPLLPEVELPWTRRVAAHLGISLEPLPSATRGALASAGGAPLPTPLDEPTLTEWRGTVAAAAGWSETTLYGEDGDALQLPATLAEMLRASPWPSVLAAIVGYAVRRRRLPYLGTGVKRYLGAPAVDAPSSSHAWLRRTMYDRVTSAPSLHVEPPAPSRFRGWSQRRLTSPFLQSLARSFAPPWTGVATTFRLPLMDDRVLAVAMAAPSVPWLQGKHLIRMSAAQGRAFPGDIIWRPKTPVYGYYEALVAQWRSLWDGQVHVAPELDDWVDAPILERMLRAGSEGQVCDAWRVLELSAWLDQRRAGGRGMR